MPLCRSLCSALLCVCAVRLAEIPTLRMYRLNGVEAKGCWEAKDRRIVFTTCERFIVKGEKSKDLHTFDFIFPPAMFGVVV